MSGTCIGLMIYKLVVAKVARGSLPTLEKPVTLSLEALGIVSSFILIMECIGSFHFVLVSHCLRDKCVGLL
ncbi:hypothetical protein F383_34240 [Gossypium arboreum]|uniref:Uncharacterized protein n=1 Tax=Gossypium arboreum TaxID=29729 RepID=A0A0B0N3D7_GOSAR|nr:hypothetical protein F383_34240 [Gossypium arboreum]